MKEFEKACCCIRVVKALKCVQPRYQLLKQKNLEGVQDGSLFGFLFVDVLTLPSLQKELENFPVVIKNIDVSRYNIGP